MALAIPPGEIRAEPDHRSPRAPAAKLAKLAVVIVNFCQWRNTNRLVRQLRHSDAVRDGDAEIAVVDNASPDDPIAKKLGRLDGVSVEINRRNEGFAAAVNRGADRVESEWILLLNPDVSVEDGFLDDVLRATDRAVRADATTGVVGFQLRDSDGSPQASAGSFPTFASTLAGLFRPRSRRKCRHLETDARHDVEWVTGGCLLARRDCFRELNGMDERYFLYYEDVDFCRRVRAAGRSVWYDPSVAIAHHSPLHGRRVPAPLRLMTRHALLAYAERHWKPWQRFLLNRIVRAEASARGWLALLRGDGVGASCYRELANLTRIGGSRDRIAAAAEHLRTIASSHDLPA